MAKITGIGGVFLKRRRIKKLSRMVQEKSRHASFSLGAAAALEWTEDKAEDKGATAWSCRSAGHEMVRPE